METINQAKVFVPVYEIFPDVRSDFETFKRLLLDLSRTDTLFWCARLNLIVSSSLDWDHKRRQEFGLQQFLTNEEIERVNIFVQKHRGAQNVGIFFRGQLLELIRWVILYCRDHPDDGNTFEDPKVRRKFAQVVLIAGDIWQKRVFKDNFSLNEGIDIARERALGTIRKSVEASELSPDISKSIGRGWIFFKDYFSCYYGEFEKDFLSSTGLSVEQYYICLSAMIANFLNPDRGTCILNSTNLGQETSYRDIFEKYIALESQTLDELRNALWKQNEINIGSDENASSYNYLPLREKPILRVNDGRAIILDPVFYSEKASVGPLFIISKRSLDRKANEIFGAFGNAFESYISDILKRMFPNTSGILTKRLSCNVKGIDPTGNEIQIDACLNDITEIVLFEMKAIWIREDKILTENPEDYIKYLQEKYGVTQTTHDRRSGIAQLVRIIELLASKKWLGENNEFSQTNLIYPVLVVYDSLLSAPVYGNFLLSEFEKLLKPDAKNKSGELKKENLRIAPLIVITVEDMEDLETSIEHFGLRNLLADYTQSCPDRLMSIRNFVVSSSKYQFYHNRNIANKAAEVLRKTQDIFLINSDKSS